GDDADEGDEGSDSVDGARSEEIETRSGRAATTPAFSRVPKRAVLAALEMALLVVVPTGAAELPSAVRPFSAGEWTGDLAVASCSYCRCGYGMRHRRRRGFGMHGVRMRRGGRCVATCAFPGSQGAIDACSTVSGCMWQRCARLNLLPRQLFDALAHRREGDQLIGRRGVGSGHAIVRRQLRVGAVAFTVAVGQHCVVVLERIQLCHLHDETDETKPPKWLKLAGADAKVACSH
ncbi:hypothetical protein THASP1DRAFT_25504, partial [Thamnocephalis sphaerospora]